MDSGMSGHIGGLMDAVRKVGKIQFVLISGSGSVLKNELTESGENDIMIAGSPDRRIAGSPDRRIASPASSARNCSRPLASPPEFSASAGRRSDTRWPASSSDSFGPSATRHALAGRLRRVACMPLLALPLLLALAAPAAAQTIDSTEITEGETKTFTITVPSTWSNNLIVDDPSSAGAATATVELCSIVDFIPIDWDACYTRGQKNTRTFTIEVRANADSIDDPDETFNILVRDELRPFDHSFTITIREAQVTPVTPKTNATQFLSLSLDRGKDTCLVGGGSSKTYTCVKETDSAPKNVEFQVKTGQRSSSALPFRLCFSGSATRRTGGNDEQDDYLIQERVGSAWQTRNSSCVDSSIAANEQLRRFRIQVIGDNHYEQVPMWINGRERLVISGQETVNITLNPDPAKPLPSPYGIDSVFSIKTLVIDDNDYRQQPLAFGTWAGKPGVKEGRPSLDQDVGIPFSAQAGWDNTVTYRVVPGDEDGGSGSTAIYGTDYRLRGDYNRNTNRGTMTLAKGKTVATLPITVIEDELIEGTETVVLEMVDTGPHEVAKPNHRITIYIQDDEATPLLKVDEFGKVLRDGVDSGHRIKIALAPVHASIPNRPLQVDAHFEYCVTGSATLGEDYTLVRPDGTKVKTGCHLATLPKGELSTYLDLNLFDDGSSDEPDESVKIRLQKSTVPGKETTDLLKIPDSTRTAAETISTVITIKDDLPVLKVSGYDDTSKRDRRFRAIFTITSVNGALPTGLYVKWEVEDTGNVVNDNRRQGLGKSGYKSLNRGFSEFTVPISIRHDAGAGTVTFKVTATGRPFRLVPGSNCVRINNGLCPLGNNAPAIQIPDTAVSNLQLAAVDDVSASVTWDAVEHATSYDVYWEAESSDLQTVVSGAESVTGTSVTIGHNAQEAMTLTVTVTPEHLDGNGVTQQLGALAATATLAVGPDGDALSASVEDADAQAPSCVSDALLADARLAASETWRTSPGHVGRWSRVLAAFGVSNAYSSNPMTVAEAQAQADRGLKRWVPVVPALECLAAAPQEQPEQAEEQPATPATPELSLSAGSAVDEGGNAAFTITADPAPQSDLTIAWTVAQSGEYLASPGAGSRTVTLAAGETGIALSVATADDEADEADGSVSVTLGTGTGYTVAAGKGRAAVAVRDNDEAPGASPQVSVAAGSAVAEGGSASFTVTASPVPATPLEVALTIAQSGEFAASGETGQRTVTVPVSGTVDVEVATVDDDADEPDGSVAVTVNAGTGYAVAAPPGNSAEVQVSDNDPAPSGPTVSVADATFKENQGRGFFTITLSEPAEQDGHRLLRDARLVAGFGHGGPGLLRFQACLAQVSLDLSGQDDGPDTDLHLQ